MKIVVHLLMIALFFNMRAHAETPPEPTLADRSQPARASTPPDDTTRPTEKRNKSKKSLPRPSVVGIPPMYEGWQWDAELEGLYAFWDRANIDHPWFFRAETGILRIREPWFASLKLGFNFGGVFEMGGSLQVSFVHLWSGLWIELLSGISKRPDAVLGVSLGWSLFGIEYQAAPFGNDAEMALIAKLRIPIGTIFFGLTKMSRKSETASSKR